MAQLKLYSNREVSVVRSKTVEALSGNSSFSSETVLSRQGASVSKVVRQPPGMRHDSKGTWTVYYTSIASLVTLVGLP